MNITDVLERHAAWLRGEAGVERANLRGAILCEVNLSGANLRGADLIRANLTKAILHGADLRWANLRMADLTKAGLRGADLRDADLCGADLCDAILSGADLNGADLSGVDLRGATLDPTVPVVIQIDTAILAALDAGGALEMNTWHCGTAHCRGGWAITRAGEAGRKLEEELGPCTAAALIYAASRPNKPVPDFYASTADTLADLRRCAGEED